MKKILVLADIHQKSFVLNSLDIFFHKNNIDAVLILGDLTDRNDEAFAFAKDFYSLVVKRHNLELLYIHGNNEPQDVIDFFDKKGCSIHNNLKVFGGIRFLGIGGWCEDIAQSTLNNIKRSFFVTHLPPLKRGINKSIKNAPIIHAFGHSHRNEYFKKEGNTFYLSLRSAGYFKRAAIVNIPNLKVEFVSI